MTDDYHPCGGLTPLLVALATGLVLKFSASTQLPISDVPIPYIRLYTVCICFFQTFQLPIYQETGPYF